MKEDKFLKQFIKDRREALTKAVMDDDWTAVRRYCRKYHVDMPKEKRIFKAGVYKAAVGCTDLPQDVIDTAFVKCLELGFSPLIDMRSKE